MAAPLVNDITEVTFLGRCNGQRIMNVFHYRAFAAWSSPTINQYHEDFYNQIKAVGTFDIVTSWLALHASTYILEHTRVQTVHPIRYRSRTFTSGASGTQAGTSTAQNVQASVTKLTEQAGRHYVGGFRIGALSEDDYEGGLILPPLTTRIGTWKGKMMAQVAENLGPGLSQLVIFHKVVVQGVAGTLVTDLVTQPQIRTQRTRTIGKGE